ncbi:unnamed protein product [Mytilus edulis]|uniref:DZIP3-like HEPN domain-containing protein n=1 Tax=Mytilus edulis TaxID=6550 RepID=A0A8S3PM10_MYTED|nr:unnamed protein product [Mytilus edulis]
MEKLPNTDDFTIELCYKILRYENVLHEPSCKWGNVPHDTEVEIGDDVQRILNATNDVISNATIYISSLDKNRCAKCSMVVMEVFPMIMQELMAHTGVPAKVLYDTIMRNISFRRNLNKMEFDMLLPIPPPSRQWGANPNNIEIGIGDDIERIRRERNSFVHRVNANISEALFESFFATFIAVGKRIDAYLNKPPNNGYAHDVEQCKTCVLDPEVEKKLLDARADIEQLKEKFRFVIGIPGKEIYIFVGKSTEAAIEKIRAEEDYNDNEEQQEDNRESEDGESDSTESYDLNEEVGDESKDFIDDEDKDYIDDGDEDFIDDEDEDFIDDEEVSSATVITVKKTLMIKPSSAFQCLA